MQLDQTRRLAFKAPTVSDPRTRQFLVILDRSTSSIGNRLAEQDRIQRRRETRDGSAIIMTDGRLSYIDGEKHCAFQAATICGDRFLCVEKILSVDSLAAASTVQ